MYSCGELGLLWEWAGLTWRGRRDKDGTDTEDEPDLQERFVSLCHRSTRRRADIVPFLSEPQGCNPLEHPQDYLSWRRH